jgi:hypothetical protein
VCFTAPNVSYDLSYLGYPDVETLSESEHIAVLKKAEYGLRQTRTLPENQANAAVSLDID